MTLPVSSHIISCLYAIATWCHQHQHHMPSRRDIRIVTEHMLYDMLHLRIQHPSIHTYTHPHHIIIITTYLFIYQSMCTSHHTSHQYPYPILCHIPIPSIYHIISYDDMYIHIRDVFIRGIQQYIPTAMMYDGLTQDVMSHDNMTSHDMISHDTLPSLAHIQELLTYATSHPQPLKHIITTLHRYDTSHALTLTHIIIHHIISHHMIYDTSLVTRCVSLWCVWRRRLGVEWVYQMMEWMRDR